MAANDSPSWFRQKSKALDHSLRLFFFRLGYRVSGRPKTVIAMCLALTCLCLVGLLQFTTENRDFKLWIPQNTIALEQKDWIDEKFPAGVRQERMIVTAANSGDDIATQSSLMNLITLLRVSEATTSNFEGEELTWGSVCRFDNGTAEGESFCSFTSVLDLFYNVTLLTDPPNFLDTVEANINENFETDEKVKNRLDENTYSTWNDVTIQQSDIMAGTSGSGPNFNVQAFKLVWLLKNELVEQNGEALDERAESWERQWITNLNGVSVEGVSGLTWYVNAVVSAIDSAQDTMDGDVNLFMIGYVLLAIYVSLAMGELHSVRSRGALSLAALISVGLAVASTIGLCSALGMWYGPVHQVLPLLMLGVGIDDAFVIVTAFDSMDEKLEKRERIGRAISQAGAAVTVTSITNSATFFIGSITQIPALRYFAIWAGVGILFDFLYQTTFFVAFLTFDVERQEKNKLDYLCCITSKNTKKTNAFGAEFGILKRFFVNSFGPFILQKKVRAIILTLTFAGLGVCVYGVTLLKQDFQIEYFYVDGTYTKEFDNVEQEFFGDNTLPFNVYTGAEEYASEDTQRRMNRLFSQPDGLIEQDEWVQPETVESWYLSFRAAQTDLNLITDEDIIPEDEYADRLESFLAEAGLRFVRDVVFEDDNERIIATRSYATLRALGSNDEQVDAMQSIRASVKEAGLVDTFPFAFDFLFYEQYVIIPGETVTSIVASLAVVLIISVVLVGNVYAAFITLLGVAFR